MASRSEGAHCLEVVAASLEDLLAAVEGGADRIELVGSHGPGGATTPSAGFMAMARKLSDVDLFAMVRPRLGPFAYGAHELDLMVLDIESARAAGLDGVMFGAVRFGEGGETHLDEPAMERLLDAAGDLRVCMNMAFDRCRDPFATLDWLLLDGRVERILTAGGERRAVDGAGRIARLMDLAGSHIVLMPGSAIDRETLAALIEALPDLTEIHVSNGVRPNGDMAERVDRALVAELCAQLRGAARHPA